MVAYQTGMYPEYREDDLLARDYEKEGWDPGYWNKFYEKIIGTIAEMGFKTFEFCPVKPDREFFKWVERLKDEYGLEVCDLHPWPGKLPASPSDKERCIKTLQWYIQNSSLVDTSIIALHPPSLSAAVNPENARSHMMISLLELTDMAEECGATISVENSASGSYSTAHEMLNLVQAVDSKALRLHLDIGHAAMVCESLGDNLVKYVEELGKFVVSCHVHDFDGKFDHRFISEGKIDFGSILRTLKRVGYEGALVMEVEYVEPKVVDSKRRLEKILREIGDATM